jgi:hypothetical protein
MKILENEHGYWLFYCDDCARLLDDGDRGTPYWEDYERFLETVGTDEEEPTLFLCRRCLTEREEGHDET